MDNAYYFADETGSHSGGRYFLVAGVALSKYRLWVKDELEQAERASGKGKQDWKGTRHVPHRVNYIERVLAMENLRGTFFYAEYTNNRKEYWAYTVEALVLAITRFGKDRHNIVRHQGLNFKSRQKLKQALARSGYSIEIQSGSERRAEIRLADALSGYLGLVRHNSGSRSAADFPNVPEWVVNLKNEAPS